MASDKEANIKFNELDFNPLRVDGKEKDPNKHYRWVSTANRDQYNRQRAKGFVPVDRTKSGVRVEMLDKPTDSTIRVGDLVLCEIPRDRKEALDRQNWQKGETIRQAPETAFRQAVESATREVRDKGLEVGSLLVDEKR